MDQSPGFPPAFSQPSNPPQSAFGKPVAARATASRAGMNPFAKEPTPSAPTNPFAPLTVTSGQTVTAPAFAAHKPSSNVAFSAFPRVSNPFSRPASNTTPPAEKFAATFDEALANIASSPLAETFEPHQASPSTLPHAIKKASPVNTVPGAESTAGGNHGSVVSKDGEVFTSRTGESVVGAQHESPANDGPINTFDDEDMLQKLKTTKGLQIEPIFKEMNRARSEERQRLIREGKIDDPEHPKPLSEAIDFRGTCRNKCPSHEIITRCYQNMMDKLEKGPDGKFEASLFVKCFHRPAAGVDAPLPRDVRSPQALMQTTDYLIHDVLMRHPLETSHGFLRDRTRGVRQDFTYQNYRHGEAVYCHEAIARFHILSLHRLCEKPGFEVYQEMEQFTKTLTSLSEFYSDGYETGTYHVTEPEFRSYQIIAQLDFSKTQDLLRKLPVTVRISPQVRLALLFVQLLKQGNALSFFHLLKQSAPYLMACLLETRFTDIRRQALHIFNRHYMKSSRMFSLNLVQRKLGYETEAAVEREWLFHGYKIQDGSIGKYIAPVKTIPKSRRSVKQSFHHELVEAKAVSETAVDIVLPRAVDRTNYSGFAPERFLSGRSFRSSVLSMTVDLDRLLRLPTHNADAVWEFNSATRTPDADFGTLLISGEKSSIGIYAGRAAVSDNRRAQPPALDVFGLPEETKLKSASLVPATTAFTSETPKGEHQGDSARSQLPSSSVKPDAFLDLTPIPSMTSSTTSPAGVMFSDSPTILTTKQAKTPPFTFTVPSSSPFFDISSRPLTTTEPAAEPKPAPDQQVIPSFSLGALISTSTPTLAPPSLVTKAAAFIIKEEQSPVRVAERRPASAADAVQDVPKTIPDPSLSDVPIAVLPEAALAPSDEFVFDDITSNDAHVFLSHSFVPRFLERIFYRWLNKVRLLLAQQEAEERKIRSALPMRGQWWPIAKDDVPDELIPEFADRVFNYSDMPGAFAQIVGETLQMAGINNHTWRLLAHNADWSFQSNYWWHQKLLGGRAEIKTDLGGGNTFRAQAQISDEDVKEVGALVYGCSPDFSYSNKVRFDHDKRALHNILDQICKRNVFRTTVLVVICYRSPLDNTPADCTGTDDERTSEDGRIRRIEAIKTALELEDVPSQVIGKDVLLIETIEDVEMAVTLRNSAQIYIPKAFLEQDGLLEGSPSISIRTASSAISQSPTRANGFIERMRSREGYVNSINKRPRAYSQPNSISKRQRGPRYPITHLRTEIYQRYPFVSAHISEQQVVSAMEREQSRQRIRRACGEQEQLRRAERAEKIRKVEEAAAELRRLAASVQ